jgi:hypothetical protein
MNKTSVALTKREKSNFLLRATTERAAWVKARSIAEEKELATVERVLRVYKDFTSVEDQTNESREYDSTGAMA